MTSKINGVALNDLNDTIEAIQADKTLAWFEFRIENEWIDGGYNKTTVKDYYGVNDNIAHETGFEMFNDEPPVLLSGDKAPNPAENLLHAIAGCVTTSIAYHAAAKGVSVDAIRTRFEGDVDLRGFLGLSDEVRPGYKGIRVVFDIEGDLTTEEKRELMALGPKFSPIFDSVSNGVPIECSISEDANEKARK